MAIGLGGVDHIVVLMLENRSFDHMLGFLYRDTANVSAHGDPFDGLTGTEACPGADGTPVQVFPITPSTANAYFLPGADPGEGFLAANAQLFGTASPPAGAIPSGPPFGVDVDGNQSVHSLLPRGWQRSGRWPCCLTRLLGATGGAAHAHRVVFTLLRESGQDAGSPHLPDHPESRRATRRHHPVAGARRPGTRARRGDSGQRRRGGADLLGTSAHSRPRSGHPVTL